ncbi:MAG: VOC family protein [Acidobacteriota bacterium]
MSEHPRSAIIPTLRYRDTHAAIDFLCRAFGFERHLVIESDEGLIQHAQLVFRGGMIMLGSDRDDAFSKMQRPPSDAGGPVHQSPYLVVEDADAHHQRAVEAGATIVRPLEDQEYGSRDYSARDPEGYLWNFGTYDPWAEPSEG